MKCVCGCIRDRVIETRRLDDETWRRRECFDCGARWWTAEKKAEAPPNGLHKISKGVRQRPVVKGSTGLDLAGVWR